MATREESARPGAPGAAGDDAADDGLVPDHFLFGVATAGFQVEGGMNGPGEPANNWLAWEQVGRVTPSGDAVGFWDRPEESLDRAAALGCDSFRLGVEWARVMPDGHGIDRSALARYVTIVEGCLERGLTPLVTLHHFTNPAWLGEDLWLRPDAPARYAAYARVVVSALAPSVRHWVTVNEMNVMALMTYVLAEFPPGRALGFADAAISLDNMLCAHVFGYDTIHDERPDAMVTTNNACTTLYEYDRMLVDLLLARSMGVGRHDLDGWVAERRRRHYALLPTPGPGRVCFGGRRPGLHPTARPDGPRRRRAGPSMPSRRVPMSARSTCSESTTTTRWRRGTSAFPVTGRRAGGARHQPASCGTTRSTPAG